MNRAFLLLLMSVMVLVRAADLAATAPVTVGTAGGGKAGGEDEITDLLPVLRTGDLVELLQIPAGSCAVERDGSRRTLRVSRPFLLGRCEVTQGLWRALMQDNPSRLHGDDLPVEWVTWNACQEFLDRLSQRDGRTYRLPSEDEWEYACRAGSGDDRGDGNRERYEHTRALTPVAACPANAWGLRGMNGNVFEWCADVLSDGRRAMRGGSCNLYPTWCHPGDRLTYPEDFAHERRGLRLASDVADQ
jgi:formylglycine-generating enzyme required for sulfatase activity